MMDNGGLNGKGKPELKAGEGGQAETKKGREKNWQRRTVSSLLHINKRSHTQTLSHTHTHTQRRVYTSCLMLRSVCMLGHAEAECCRCYLPMSVWPANTPCKKHWWAGFKEPYLLFQHQKVHLGASVIFHPFPRLRLGYIMMSNSLSLSLSLSSSLQPLVFHPHLLPHSPSLPLCRRFHIQHRSFCCINNKRWLLPKRIRKRKKKRDGLTLNSVCSWWCFDCNQNFMQKKKKKNGMECIR